MKKYLYKLIIATLILLSTAVVSATNEVYYTNKNNIDMTLEEYNNLLELGFTESQIYYMTNETFLENKDIEATLVSRNTQFVKTTTFWRNGISYHTSEILTEEEIMHDMELHNGELQIQQPVNSPNTSGYCYNDVSYDYKVLTTSISFVSDTTMRYKADVFWLEMPDTRSYDIIGIGIEPSKVEINSIIYFQQHYVYTNGNDGYGTICYPKEQTTGGSVLFKLPSGSFSDLDSYIYFNVTKVHSDQTITSLAAVGDYAHATSSVTDSVFNYYTVNHVAGIDVTGSYYNSYDIMSTATATFLGTW